MPSGQIIDVPILSFEGFTVDLERLSLHRGADRIPLTPTPFKVLSFLAQRPGTVVSKEQLLDAVWGERRETNTVEQAVRQVRRALGDDKGLPRFIQTIPGEGYCFIAKLDDAVAAEPKEGFETRREAEAPPTRPGIKGRGLTDPIALVSIFVMLVGVVAGSLIVRHEAQIVLAVENPVRLTRPETHILSPLQSDGVHIVYPRFENGRYGIEEIPIAGGESQLVTTGIANPELCDLSPDGKRMLIRDLVHSRDEDEPLYVSSGTGMAKRVGQILAYDAAWFPDGQRILYSSKGVIYASDVEGRTPEKLFTVPGNAFWFRWSPDGKWLRFTVIDEKSEETSIWEASKSGHSPHRLFSDLHYHLCCGSWTPDGNNFLFQARVQNTFQIWAQRDPNSVGFLFQRRAYPVAFGAMSYRGPLPSKDGSKLFVRSEDVKGELVRFDARLGDFNSVLPSISARTAAFSRDGQQLAYTSLRDNNLWRCRADGSECVELTRDFKNTVTPSWSPDGRSIAFMGLTFAGMWQVYIVSTDGGPARQVSHSDQAKGYADWSLDGEQIFFSDVPPVSRPQGIYVLALRTGEVSVIPGSTEFFYPRISPDGRHLLAQHAGDLSLYMYKFASKKWVSLAKVQAWYPSWSHDGKFVYFRGGTAENPAILRAAVPDGTVEKVASLSHVDRGPFFMGDWVGLTADDQPIAVRNSTIEDIYAWDLVRK